MFIFLNFFFSPKNCSSEFWYGSLKNSCQLGLFRPEETMAHLGAENPSTTTLTTSTNISEKKTSKHSTNKTNEICDKERRKLLISQPQGDLRHTCHVGIDGKTFGLLNVSIIKSQIIIFSNL